MAELIGADKKLAARAGLLHDIGKALDHDPQIQGTHVELGVEVLRKNGEKEDVINAVEAHHGDVEPQTVEAILVQAADAISSSRPGARRDTLESYITRLENLERIANSFLQQHVFVKAAGIKRADNAFTRCIGINIACFHGKQAAHGGFGSVLFAFDAEIADCKIGCPNRGGKTHGHKCDGKLLEFHHLLSKK